MSFCHKSLKITSKSGQKAVKKCHFGLIGSEGSVLQPDPNLLTGSEKRSKSGPKSGKKGRF